MVGKKAGRLRYLINKYLKLLSLQRFFGHVLFLHHADGHSMSVYTRMSIARVDAVNNVRDHPKNFYSNNKQ